MAREFGYFCWGGLLVVLSLSACGEPARDTGNGAAADAQATGSNVDIGTVDTSTPSQSGCRNAEDLAALAAIPQDPTSVVQQAFLACIETPEMSCYRAAVAAIVSTSDACLGCHADMVGCVTTNCSEPCLIDSDGAPCDRCVTESGCDALYTACSGIEPEESIVTILEGNTYCTLNAALSSEVQAKIHSPIEYQACSAPSDEAILQTEGFQTMLELCGEACFVKGRDFAAQCVLEKIGTSLRCARCLGNQVVLGGEEVPCI